MIVTGLFIAQFHFKPSMYKSASFFVAKPDLIKLAVDETMLPSNTHQL